MSRILIVEDGVSVTPCRLSRRLRQTGHEVETSRNTEAMWAALLQRPADLIVLNLPDGAGCHVLPLLRERFPASALLLHATSQGHSHGDLQAQLAAMPAEMAQLARQVAALEAPRTRRAGQVPPSPGATPRRLFEVQTA